MDGIIFVGFFSSPQTYPSGYCHGGGLSVNILMVDWFNPVPDLPVPGCEKAEWEELTGEPIEIKLISLQKLMDDLIPFLQTKSYLWVGFDYLVITDFGASFIFNKDTQCEKSD